MSHYTVAVFHRKDQLVASLLEPYDENKAVDPYIKFTRDEAIDYARRNYEGFGDKSDDECWQVVADDYDGKTDDMGNVYSTYNPQSKWDWYSIGGRWSGEFMPSDEARVKDIDFIPDKDKYDEAYKFWKDNVDGDGDDRIFKREYYINRYCTAETFALVSSGFFTYAVVTPDGKWHAPGEMGWFGCSTESDEDYMNWVIHYKERFIDSADPEWILTIVDCHI